MNVFPTPTPQAWTAHAPAANAARYFLESDPFAFERQFPAADRDDLATAFTNAARMAQRDGADLSPRDFILRRIVPHQTGRLAQDRALLKFAEGADRARLERGNAFREKLLSELTPEPSDAALSYARLRLHWSDLDPADKEALRRSKRQGDGGGDIE